MPSCAANSLSKSPAVRAVRSRASSSTAPLSTALGPAKLRSASTASCPKVWVSMRTRAVGEALDAGDANSGERMGVRSAGVYEGARGGEGKRSGEAERGSAMASEERGRAAVGAAVRAGRCGGGASGRGAAARAAGTTSVLAAAADGAAGSGTGTVAGAGVLGVVGAAGGGHVHLRAELLEEAELLTGGAWAIEAASSGDEGASTSGGMGGGTRRGGWVGDARNDARTGEAAELDASDRREGSLAALSGDGDDGKGDDDEPGNDGDGTDAGSPPSAWTPGSKQFLASTQLVPPEC